MRCLSVVCWLLLHTLPVQGQARLRPPVLTGTDQFTHSGLAGYLWCRDDSAGTLTAALFRQQMHAGQPGQLTPGDVPNFGDSNHPHWIGFRFRSGFSTPRLMIIECDFTSIDQVVLWVWEGDRLVKQSPAISWQTPFASRDVPHKVPAFRFMARPGLTYDCALRLQKNTGSLMAPLGLFTETEFLYHTTRNNLLHGIAAGCLLLAILLGVAFWLLTRQAHYGFYAWYVLGVLLFLLEDEGYLNSFMLAWNDLLAGPSAWAICSLFAMLGHTLFVIRFLRLGQLTITAWVWSGWLVAVCCCLLLLPMLAGYYSETLYQAALDINLVYAILQFSYLFVALRYHRSETTLYLLAGGPFFVTILWVCFSTFGLLPRNRLMYELLNYSPVWEVAVLCTGLAVTFSRAQRLKVAVIEEIARLQSQLVQALDETQEAERRRIAQDLHDDVGNTLAAAKGSLNIIRNRLIVQTDLPEVANAHSLIEKAGQDLRTISHNLMPVEFDKYKLTDVVQQVMERAGQTSPVQFQYVQAGTEQRLSPERSLVIYRIINELINNILKHSGASLAVVQFMFQPNALIITVEDDGRGFPATQTDIRSPGIGLKSVTSRADYIGARLDISSNASGTCVMLELKYG
jgi:signal transduction histidine kinase